MLLGKRITIGPLVPEDFGPLFCWANDVAAARLDFAYRPLDMMAHQKWWDGLGKDASRVVFAIRKIESAALIGYVQITNIHAVHRSAEIGMRIGAERDRGQGYGKEALGLAVDYCWTHLNLQRLHLAVFKQNPRAIRAYATVGFKKEGVLRRAAYIGGTWVDIVLMAALRPRPPRQRAAQTKSAADTTATAAPLVPDAGRHRALEPA